MKKLLFALFFFPSLALAGGGCDLIALGDTSCKLLLKAVQSSDHLTEMTTSSAWTCKKSENGGTPAACAGSVAELSDADAPGTLVYTLNSADVDTAGSLLIRVTATGMDPADATAQVSLPYNIVGPKATLQSASSTGAVLAASESYGNSQLIGNRIQIISGTAANSFACITANTGASDSVTVASWSGGTPDATSTYDILPDPACQVSSSGGSGISATRKW